MKILGTNPRCYPQEPGLTGRIYDVITVKVVLVAEDAYYYAAYAGIGSDTWVARFGDKISFEEACIHFPGGQLKRELYRD